MEDNYLCSNTSVQDLTDLSNDPTLIDICKNLPKLHFSRDTFLLTTPVGTIQDEYYKRNGKLISRSICELVYLLLCSRGDIERIEKEPEFYGYKTIHMRFQMYPKIDVSECDHVIHNMYETCSVCFWKGCCPALRKKNEVE